MLIGFCCGFVIVEVKDNRERMEKFFLIGTILMFAGFLFRYGMPISKKLWTPTFAIVTCGLAASLLALLIWIIDVKGYKRWTQFFEAFGVNPLFMYVLGGVLGILFNTVPVFGLSIHNDLRRGTRAACHRPHVRVVALRVDIHRNQLVDRIRFV